MCIQLFYGGVAISLLLQKLGPTQNGITGFVEAASLIVLFVMCPSKAKGMKPGLAMPITKVTLLNTLDYVYLATVHLHNYEG